MTHYEVKVKLINRESHQHVTLKLFLCSRLAEIAHALLKLAPYDTLTMESRGLRRYIMEMLPITDWSSEAVRPALILILKRLDRMFNKIHKMPTLRCARPQALCSRSVEYDHFYLCLPVSVSCCAGAVVCTLVRRLLGTVVCKRCLRGCCTVSAAVVCFCVDTRASVKGLKCDMSGCVN